jgi:BNR repeat-like domain
MTSRPCLVVCGLGAVLVLAACSGQTTGASNIAQQTDGSYTARLNATGSCDQSCSTFMRWRRVGTTAWTNGPTTNNVPPTSGAHWYQDVSGLAQRTQYEYQVCGKENSWSNYACVGPSPDTTDKFTTGATALTALSTDPYTNTTSQHATEVEPDTYSSGSTVVSAFQVGRFFDGGATNIGWARSTDGGTTWTKGFLPGITTAAGGSFARVSDPSVAYDAAHNVWLIVSLPLPGAGTGAAVVVNRSTDGGATWGNPVTVATAGAGNAGTNLDKTWIACDSTASSPFYGRCYVEWDDNGNGNRIKMSTSADGGLTWGPARETANAANGLGGQPVVQPNGTVVVPANNANETAIIAFRSTNGGASWGNAATVTSIPSHEVAANLRSEPLPSAELDGAGKVYVVWQDCRFRSSCSANDIVLTTSTDGLTWSQVTRIPIHTTGSTFDHFIPGIAVDKSTSGVSARVALAYYYYPNAACTASTCQLDVGLVSSTDGGQTWTSPVQLAGPLQTAWIANTNQGPMVGDYISTSFSSGRARPVFASATAPSGGVFAEGMFTTPAPAASTATRSTRAASRPPVLSTSSDRPAAKAPVTHR